MKGLLAILIVIALNVWVYFYTKDENQKAMEYAYFEGQKDAIEGDIRIKYNKDSIYIWIKSPWDNRKSPIFIPTYLDSKP